MHLRLSGLLVAATLFPVGAAAQQIALKTAPIATGDQFFLLPSRGAGMGGISVAIRDTLGDPWGNPATGSRVRGGSFFAVPSGYTISNDIGAGFSFAMGGLGRVGEWFGGAAIALQQLDNPNRNRFFFDVPGVDRFIEDALGNDYAQAFIGRRLGDRTSLAASVFHAGLTAVEGVSQLYPGSSRIDQDGSFVDLRLGVVRDLSNGGAIEAVLLHSRLDMAHDVSYLNWILFEDAMQPPVPSMRVEENLDRTRTTGIQVAFETPITDDPGTTAGLSIAANRKLHPKIPNYEIANIPRDPGNSTVFALTAGVARTTGPSTVGMEFTWAPGRSHTWAEADVPMPLPHGGTLPAGGRTVENWFRFSNARAATGYEHDGGGFAFRFGFDVDWYGYRLEQVRWIEDTRRKTKENWFEWSPTWGLTARPAGFQIHYTGRLQAKGFPDLFGGQVIDDFAFPDRDGPIDFLPAPSGPADLPDFAQWTHQIGVSLLIGR